MAWTYKDMTSDESRALSKGTGSIKMLQGNPLRDVGQLRLILHSSTSPYITSVILKIPDWYKLLQGEAITIQDWDVNWEVPEATQDAMRG